MANVQDLHRALGQLIEMGLGESELRFTYQSNYPLQDFVEGLWFDEEAYYNEDAEEASEEASEDQEMTLPTVYLVSGGQDHDSPYGPRQAFEEATLDF